jgi:hypothetical protein
MYVYLIGGCADSVWTEWLAMPRYCKLLSGGHVLAFLDITFAMHLDTDLGVQ